MSKNKKLKISADFMVVIALFIVAVIIIKCIFLGKNKTEEDDIGKVYYYQTELEHIACKDSGVMYADNEILVVAESSAKEKDIQKLAEKYKAEIVGCIEITGDYQWLLSDTYNRDELDSLVEELENEKCIESACLNFVSEVSVESSNVQYGDEWKNAEWSSVNVGGKNWNLEAIHAMEAWEYLDKDNAVRVGLIDGGFDAPNVAECCVTPSGSIKGHDDLVFAATFYNDIATITKDGNGLINHGTHVAGTMAANADNDEGICGVYPFGKGNLYGASFVNASAQNYITGMEEKCTYAELILRNVKVINCSYGGYGGLNCYAAAWQAELYDDDIAKNLIESANLQADTLARFFERLFNNGYDFVIVQGSGNASNFKVLRLKYDYESAKFITDNNGNVTHDINGVPWCVFKDKNNRFYVDLQDGKGKRGINNFDESQIKTAGFVDSIYTIPATINKEKYPDLYNRIIVVGSFGFHDTIVEEGTGQIYFTEQSTASSSNLGTRVDILAPGENIFSTTYYADADDKAQGVKKGDKYQYMGGTSMAAPHVSGVAAMVWTANNQLTGEEVKQIICENADTIYHYDGGDKAYPAELKYGTLNAQHAVEAALDAWHKEIDGKDVIVVVLDDTEPQNGGILGYVVDSVDSTEKISGADITATDEDGKEYTVQTDSEGHFELVLPDGVYTLKAKKADYIETVLPGTYTVKAEEVITLKQNIKLESVENAFINTVIDNESDWKDSSSEMWFQDLNFDGQNELIVGNMFRYEVYTYVNNSLHKVEQQGNVNENWHPLYNMKLCYNAESGKYVGITRIGITMWMGMFETSYENDKLKFTEIVSMNEGDAAYGVQSTWYDGSGNTITESEYVELYNNYFKNLTEVAYTIDSIMLTDYNKLIRNEKFNRLKKSYEAFQIGEEIGGFSQIEVSAFENKVDIYENMEITLNGIIRPQHYEKDMVIGDTAVLDLQDPFTAVFHGGNRDGETEFIETVQVEIEGVEAPELGMFTTVTGKIIYANAENHICSIVLVNEEKDWKKMYLEHLENESNYMIKSGEFALINLNNDEIPDIFCRYEVRGFAGGGQNIWAYVEGEVRSVSLIKIIGSDGTEYQWDGEFVNNPYTEWNNTTHYSLDEIKTVIQNY